MNRCRRNGYLVDATRTIPTDPTVFDVDGVPVTAFLRQLRTPSTLLRTMNALLQR